MAPLPAPPATSRYDANATDVQDFLPQMIPIMMQQKQSWSCGTSKGKIDIPSPALYQVPDDDMKELYGSTDRMLYGYIQNSAFGRVNTESMHSV